MTEYLAGGRRRIDRVLAPEFLTGLESLELDELRGRRADADQEEVDLSYARRLLQGRIDILRSEQERRRNGQDSISTIRTDEDIVAHLTAILADDRPADRGLGRHVTGTPSRIGEHRREAERAVADVGGSDLAGLSDADLAVAVAELADIEARTSRSRRMVQQVADTLTEEVARRYSLGPVGAAGAASV